MIRMQRWLCSVLFALFVTTASFGQVLISVNFAPPELPVYEQPLCPGEGYIWTPGYWAWDPDYGYFWVPGTWVLAPEIGFLWTPGWWGFESGLYYWHPGYWGPEVGFYGGIVYGYGYYGNGYQGGYWRDRQFYYNRAVNNVTNVTYVYNNTTVVNSSQNVARASYNGGQGGVSAHPTAQQQAVLEQRHVNMTPAQTQHEQSARSDRQLFAEVNHGRPAIAATPKPAMLHGSGTVPATSAAHYNPPPRTATKNGTPNNASPNNGRPASTPPPPENRAPARNEVPRPPNSTRPESKPATEAPNPRNESPRNAQPEPAPRPNENAQPATRPPAPRNEPAPRPEAAPRPEPQTRPTEPPRPQAEPRQQPERPQVEHPAPQQHQEAPRPEMQRQEAPRPQAEPQRAEQPRTQPQPERSEPKPEPPRNERPEDRPPQ